MNKNSYELLDDGFLNLYEEGIFVRCFPDFKRFFKEMAIQSYFFKIRRHYIGVLKNNAYFKALFIFLKAQSLEVRKREKVKKVKKEKN